jgi:1-deoxy-D-xylulose-5-phosphate synthase
MILSRIEKPSDLAELSAAELAQLAGEIRAFLLDKISKTGGHLSPNLGIVELTIALHRTFDSPRDRILWDVGHQAYVHKLLTGRQDGFDRLRAFGGLSGYPSRQESEHDFVENSHASTSLSYALGHALSDSENWTVAVIGDGALTGGMAYEALSHIAVARPRRLIVVVNDNGHSYGPTIGGMAMLSNLVTPAHGPALRVGQTNIAQDAQGYAGRGRDGRRDGNEVQGSGQADARALHVLRHARAEVHRSHRRS